MPTSLVYGMSGELGPRSGLLRSILESSAGPWQVHSPLLRSVMVLHATLHWRFPSCTDIVRLLSPARAPQSGRCCFIHHYGKSPLQSLGRYSQSWLARSLPVRTCPHATALSLAPEFGPMRPVCTPSVLPFSFASAFRLLSSASFAALGSFVFRSSSREPFLLRLRWLRPLSPLLRQLDVALR